MDEAIEDHVVDATAEAGTLEEAVATASKSPEENSKTSKDDEGEKVAVDVGSQGVGSVVIRQSIDNSSIDETTSEDVATNVEPDMSIDVTSANVDGGSRTREDECGCAFKHEAPCGSGM